MVFSSRSGSKHSKKAAKKQQGGGSGDGAESSSSKFLHSPLRRSKHKAPPPAAAVSPPIAIGGRNLLELPPAAAGAASSASTTPSQFSDHSPLPPAKNGAAADPLFFAEPFPNGEPAAAAAPSPLPSPWAEEALAASMAFDFSAHQLQTLKEAFDFFDVDRDGRITSAELQSVFKFLGNPVTPEQVRLMIDEADVDGNGTVELSEFLRMMRRYYRTHAAPSTEEEEMLEAFKAFDHNGDSFIDFHEIKKTMHFLGEAVSDEEVRAMIREADADKDGRINFDEFKKMMSLMRTGQASSSK